MCLNVICWRRGFFSSPANMKFKLCWGHTNCTSCKTIHVYTKYTYTHTRRTESIIPNNMAITIQLNRYELCFFLWPAPFIPIYFFHIHPLSGWLFHWNCICIHTPRQFTCFIVIIRSWSLCFQRSRTRCRCLSTCICYYDRFDRFPFKFLHQRCACAQSCTHNTPEPNSPIIQSIWERARENHNEGLEFETKQAALGRKKKPINY